MVAVGRWRRENEAEEGGADTALKTKTPHVNVGKKPGMILVIECFWVRFSPQSFVQPRYSTDSVCNSRGRLPYSERCCGREAPRILPFYILLLIIPTRHMCIYIYLFISISAAQRAMPNCQAPGHTYDLFTHRFDDCAAG